MTSRLDKPQFLYPIMLLLAALIVFFALNLYIVGDLRFHYVLIKCYAEQFWQGDLYPRWCFNGNVGEGTLQPLFYFPLPYLISSLFYPLVEHLGWTIAQLFFLMCFFATFLAAVNCYRWLRDMITPGRALLVTVVFLLLPYRMELQAYRVAYAELWFMAWLPLILQYTRRIAKGEGMHSVARLAGAFALATLSHTICTITMIIWSAVYILFMTGLKSWRPKFNYGFALMWGLILAGFYLAPPIYYQQFMAEAKTVVGMYGWSNGFLRYRTLCNGQTMPSLATFLSAAFLFVFAFYVLVERIRIQDAYTRREVWVWAGICVMAAFLLLSYSAFLYEALKPLSNRIFPWRMRVILDAGLIYMIAVWMQWVFVPGHRHKWKIGYAVMLVPFILMDAKLGDVKFQDPEKARYIVKGYTVFVPEYRTRWIPEELWSFHILVDRYNNKDKLVRAGLLSEPAGDKDKDKNKNKNKPKSGAKAKAKPLKKTEKITVGRWNWDGIHIHTKLDAPNTIEVKHHYFPMWKAMIDNQEPIEMRPNEETGYTLIDVPAGEHDITLTYSVFNGQPLLVYSYWLSLIAFIALLVARRKFDGRENTA